MRMLTMMVLTPNKEVKWLTVPWGKGHLDYYRKQGYLILMTV
jgi:hypothetical protein